jgi:cytochrome b561
MEYSPVAKWFHWTTVVLIGIALPLGYVIGHVKDSDKMAFYAIHESAGLTLLAVASARLIYRWRHPPPPAPHLPRPMRLASGAVHGALYAALIAQPVTGFLATNAYGFPMQGATAYLGLIDLPKFMETNVPLAGALSAAHGWIGLSIVTLLVLHIGAVVFHQAIRKDDTLLRMV